MTAHRLFNILLMLAFAATLALAFHLDPEPDPSESALKSMRQLALDQCGPGAALEWKENGTLTCRRHDGRGRPSTVHTKTVHVAEVAP